MDDLVFAVLDTETTGFHPDRGDRLLEIGVVKIRNGGVVASENFCTLINPERSIPMSATRVNKITDDMVADQPLVEDIIDDFIAFLDGVDYLLIHNASFDMKFINYELKRLGKDVKFPPIVCTVELSRQLYPQYNSHSLDAISKRFGLSIEDGELRHRALGDVILTGQVFLRFYEDSPMIFLSELEALENQY